MPLKYFAIKKLKPYLYASTKYLHPQGNPAVIIESDRMSRGRVCIRWVIPMAKTPTRTGLLKELAALRKRLAKLEASPQPNSSRSETPARPAGGQSQSELEIALRERIKELDCLYTISTFREIHFQSPDRFLQSVADCLPKSWQYPEHACARIVYGGRQYLTERFAESRWRMSSDVTIDGRSAGVVEVFYRKVVPSGATGPFLKEEHALLRAVAERVGSVMMHMKALADLRAAHRTIQREHQALQEANIALRTVLARLEEEKQGIKAAVAANIQKVVMPIVFELELEVTGRQRSYVTLLRRSLQEIASPFLTHISRDHVELTPVEVAIGTMIRNGLSTKEIAQLRCISAATVRRHRENIRRKLGLRNRKANLATYLQASIASDSLPAQESPLPPEPIAEDTPPFEAWDLANLPGDEDRSPM
ncbi:MAG: LuxR family transcriptional regulator [Planctomycetes bacterium]|nr:LuxR family transcriptional regulator [Planctomycetota bacterium]